MNRVRFNVAPRYTSGSPAQVDEQLAERVAREERLFYGYVIDGSCGEKERQRAESLGLDLISFTMLETRKGWLVDDLITGKRWLWPFNAICSVCRKKRACRRGVIESHVRVSSWYGIGDCAGSGTFAGQALRSREEQ